MKTTLFTSALRSFYLSICLLLSTLIASAQNAADSDLSNEADTNKNWSGSGWLIAVVVILVLVVFFTLRRRRRG